MILVDTGYFVALLDPKDTHHALAQQWMHTQAEGWITTWSVVTETYYFLADKVHNDAALGFLEEIDNGGIALWDIPAPQLTLMRKLLSKYKQLPMDLADASLVLLAEHLGHGRILTTDQRDFGAYRWKSRKPFTDLMAAK
jgi:uncharacterized protein